MYKVIKNNKIIGVCDEYPVLQDAYEVIEDTEHTTSDFVQYNGEFVLVNSDKGILYKQEQVRAIRSQYYDDYVDWYQSKPLLWEELTEEEKTNRKNYRLYLKDYTETEGWYNQNPLTYDEWLLSQQG